jgi:hypothetical protein
MVFRGRSVDRGSGESDQGQLHPRIEGDSPLLTFFTSSAIELKAKNGWISATEEGGMEAVRVHVPIIE